MGSAQKGTVVAACASIAVAFGLLLQKSGSSRAGDLPARTAPSQALSSTVLAALAAPALVEERQLLAPQPRAHDHECPVRARPESPIVNSARLAAVDDYLGCPAINPLNRVPSVEERATLQRIIDAGNARIKETEDRFAIALHENVQLKVAAGLGEELGPGYRVGGEEGCLVTVHDTWDGQARRTYRVRTYPGEYAPLEVAADDSWREYQAATDEIRRTIDELTAR